MQSFEHVKQSTCSQQIHSSHAYLACKEMAERACLCESRDGPYSIGLRVTSVD